MYASFGFLWFLPCVYRPFVRSVWAFLNGFGEYILGSPTLLIWLVFRGAFYY